MPYVNIRTVRGALDDDDKVALLERVTQVLVDIEGGGNPAFRQFVWVSIDEVAGDNWSLGGHIPSAEEIRKFRAMAKRESP